MVREHFDLWGADNLAVRRGFLVVKFEKERGNLLEMLNRLVQSSGLIDPHQHGPDCAEEE